MVREGETGGGQQANRVAEAVNGFDGERQQLADYLA